MFQHGLGCYIITDFLIFYLYLFSRPLCVEPTTHIVSQLIFSLNIIAGYCGVGEKPCCPVRVIELGSSECAKPAN